MENASKIQPLYSELTISSSDKRNNAGWRKMELIKTPRKQASLEDATASLNKLASKPPFCYVYKTKKQDLL